MFKAEAAWLASVMSELSAEQLSPMINLGSGTDRFRRVTQPWIDSDVFQPLAARGVSVLHVDIKPGAGIDIRANLLEPDGLATLRKLRPRSLVCSNLLEHVEAREDMARRSIDMLEPGGLVFFTGPLSYPLHNDPIDTMWRPLPGEAAALFPHTDIMKAKALDVGESYLHDVRRRPWIIHRQIVHMPFPFIHYGQWKRSMKKIYWLFNNYLVTCLVLRKAAQAPECRMCGYGT